MRNQEGRIVSIDVLLNEGWKKEVYFGHTSLILSKGEERIVYSLPEQKIIVHYKSKPYPILGC